MVSEISGVLGHLEMGPSFRLEGEEDQKLMWLFQTGSWRAPGASRGICSSISTSPSPASYGAASLGKWDPLSSWLLCSSERTWSVQQQDYSSPFAPSTLHLLCGWGGDSRPGNPIRMGEFMPFGTLFQGQYFNKSESSQIFKAEWDGDWRANLGPETASPGQRQ